PQEVVPSKLHSQVAGKPIWAFHKDTAHAIARDPIQHRLEARTLPNRVCAAHSGIVELGHDYVAVDLRKGRDGRSLPLVAVLVAANVGRRASAQVGNRLNWRFPASCHGLSAHLYFLPEEKQYNT